MHLDGREALPIGDFVPDGFRVYRLYDADGCLLYVGQTATALAQRLAEHRQLRSWWKQVAFVTVESFPDRRSCRAAEAKAIREEAPRFNGLTSESPAPAPEIKLEELQPYLLRHRLTLRQLAHQAGVSRSSVEQLERGSCFRGIVARRFYEALRVLEEAS